MENPMITNGDREWNEDPFYKEDRYDQEETSEPLTIDELFTDAQWGNVLKQETKEPAISYKTVITQNSKHIRGDANLYSRDWNMRYAAIKDPALGTSVIFTKRNLYESSTRLVKDHK